MKIKDAVSGWPVDAFRRFKGRVFAGLLVSMLVPAALSGLFLTLHVLPESDDFCRPHDGPKGIFDFEWRNSDTYCTPELLASAVLFSTVFHALAIPTVAVFAALALGVLTAIDWHRMDPREPPVRNLGPVKAERESESVPCEGGPTNWANRVSLGLRQRRLRNLMVCLFVTVAVAGYIVVADAWQVSQSFCAPHYGQPGATDVPWRGPGGYCTPQVGPSLLLLLVLTVVLFLPVSAGLLALVAIILAVFSTPHDRASRSLTPFGLG